MEKLHIEQLRFILQISKDKAITMIRKSEPQLLTEWDNHNRLPEIKGSDEEAVKQRKLRKRQEKSIYNDIIIDVDAFSIAHGINLKLIVADIQNNFTKNMECVNMVCKEVSAKIKPNKTTGMYPLSIRINKYIRSFLSDDEYNKLIDMVKSVVNLEITMQNKEVFNIELI